MHPLDQTAFINKFFQFRNPIPLETRFTEEDLKNNDMKISLEIATHSNLRMQSDPKTNIVSFSCKNFGKNCYEIFAVKKQGYYEIQSNYLKVSHSRNCELKNECFEYLQIYNLMKLKKNLIEQIMIKENLFQSSPSEILTKLSREGEYFFEKNINYNPQMRRKLRKRFDNIINIDIKKITKGGRNETNDFEPKVQKKSGKQQKCCKIEEDGSEFDETSFFDEQKKRPKKKLNFFKKKDKSKKKQNIIHRSFKKQSKQNVYPKNSQNIIKKEHLQKIEDEIYENPASICELKEIKELNEEFNGYRDIFAWQSEDPLQVIQAQTTNDKLRQGMFISLRNSLLRRPLEGQSLSNFPENIGNFHVQDSQDHII